MKNRKKFLNAFDEFSSKVANFTGSSMAFIGAFAIIIIWAGTGPVFDFSVTWQLIINTGTTITTFLMVFIIQRDQNKDTMAIQLKLNELIAVTKGASNKVLNIEDLTEDELKVLKKFYIQLGEISEKDKMPGSEKMINAIKKNERKANA
ncbi:MAG TPA: low affinity iron permease family protein [Bacteroidia bacterium]|jgi:low affinity Fe/Cu permease|nr:low affinity iron permease family protein [Bacteroidia bacterium]